MASVDERIARETENALTDLVALDLGSSAGDRQGAMHELQCATHESFVFEVDANRASEFEKNCRCFFCVFGEQQLRDCAFWPGFTTGDGPLCTAHVEGFGCL